MARAVPPVSGQAEGVIIPAASGNGGADGRAGPGRARDKNARPAPILGRFVTCEARPGQRPSTLPCRSEPTGRRAVGGCGRTHSPGSSARNQEDPVSSVELLTGGGAGEAGLRDVGRAPTGSWSSSHLRADTGRGSELEVLVITNIRIENF